jgi:hypothetical protein
MDVVQCLMRSGPLNQRIPFATDDAQVEAIDEWRRRQRDLPTRSEAIRRMIDIVLQMNADTPSPSGTSTRRRKVSNG